MVTWSGFVRYINDAEKHAPRAIVDEVKREAKRRLQERLQAGRADSVLCFRDLVEKVENSICRK